jgi:hypothetical protein
MTSHFHRSTIEKMNLMKENCKLQIANCNSLIAKHVPAIGKFHLRFLACSSLSLLLTISASGCKKSSDAVPVHGRISFHGEPLASGSVTFFPKTGRPVGAAILHGKYKTELAPDEYTVALDVAPEFPKGFKEGDPLPPPKVTLPEEYANRTKSTLKATVKDGQSEPIDFELK